ncbi:Phage-like element PBSX protein XkdM (plasmid) [Apilactobacillus kunkeei]|nr:Phage-like element PBSX protein XkdM [Apilactobacillus kunkeei]CAI2673326.1 Phage-like element PBSX protein XkdM [Apilactobacillus kunkeei]CAI2803588.1 Phage-like element PBSX protein XkdM [Apilactobacillus kunkeei]
MAQPLNDLGDGQQTISTRSARIFFQRDGQNIPFAECTEFKASVKKSKEKVNTLGNFAVRHKYVGWEGTGSLSGYITNSDLLSREIGSLTTGQEQRFNIVATYYGNEQQGNQTYMLKSVSLDNLPLGDLKSDDGVMKFETDFTFEGIDLIDKFNN